MVTSLFRYERITTTKAKALEVRKAAEKLITRSKVDSVHNRRQVARFVQDEIILNKLFKEIGPRMKERNGGYTRVLKLGFRQGDAADVVILELVDYKLDTESKAEKKEAKAEKKEAAPKAEVKSEKKPAAKKTTKTSEKKDGEAKAAPKKSTAKAKTTKTEETVATAADKAE
jgi:large subunit ribosomal protein L17